MPPSESSMQNTPLAPSVEKAYYRKCIELKRRLNEVEAANDELKIRRVRLDRGIMKMRLERAFLLDELRKRMDYHIEASDNSGEEGLATPPPDRPHRDKRRRLDPAPAMQRPPSGLPSQPTQYQALPPATRVPSQVERDGLPPAHPPQPLNNSASPVDAYARRPSQANHQHHHPANQHAPGFPQSSPYHARASMSSAPDGQVNGANPDAFDERASHTRVSQSAGTAGEALSAGPAIREDANGERRIVASASATDGSVEP